LALEIQNDTSLPLVETRLMDLEYLLNNRFQILITRNPDAISSLGSWKAKLKLLEMKDNGKLVNQELTLDFDNCYFTSKTAIPDEIRPPAKTLGLLIGHKYFVRQKQDGKTLPPPPPAANGTDSPGSDEPCPDTLRSPEFPTDQTDAGAPESPEPDADSPPPDEPQSEDPASEAPSQNPDGVRLFTERKEERLQVDIRDEDEKDLNIRKSKIKHTLEDNKSKVIALLKGQTEGIDPAEVLLHRKIEGLKDGQFIFERVKTEEIKQAMGNGTLGDQDWYILNTLPHVKALGYRALVRQEGVSGLPYWRVSRSFRTKNAEMAYLYYQDSGFPDLSSFRDLQASFSIIADATYNQGQLWVSTDDGTELCKDALCNVESTEKDLNARLALLMRDNAFMEGWLESQQRVLEQEINEIIKISLAENDLQKKFEQLTEIKIRDKQIKDLPELIQRMMKESSVRVDKSPDGVRASVRLALGWVPTQTSFNQGNYFSLAQLKAEIDRKSQILTPNKNE